MKRKAKLTKNGYPNGRICKICKLQKTNREAFLYITEMIKNSEMSFSKIVIFVSKKYKVKITKMNISNHKSHMWDHDLLKAATFSKIKEKDSKVYDTSHGESIYLIKAGKYHKIGITTNLHARIRSIMTGNPENVEIISLKEVDSHKHHEKELHNKFKHKCKRGEWFLLDENDVSYVVDYLNSCI